MNIPTLLTLLRIFFVPLLVAALLGEGVAPWIERLLVSRETFALAIFLTAAATDLLDGYLARRWSQITTVGTLLDPIADKLLISAALVSLVDIHRIPAWMVILIIGREFAVSGLRSIAAASGYTIEASDLGKTKMAAQVLAIALVIGGIRWPQLTQPGLLVMWAVLLFALVSAADYFLKFWRKVDTEVKLRRRKELLDLQREQRQIVRASKAQARAEKRKAAKARRSAGVSAGATLAAQATQPDVLRSDLGSD